MPEPIESYGLLGDTRTAALVSEQGSIDWLCIPRFDGSPLFGALIDGRHGGRWSIRITDGRVVDRCYSEGAASIRTTWEGSEGTATVTEGLISDTSTHLLPRMTLVRHLECLSGTVDVELLFDPRVGLPGKAPERVRRSPSALICEWGDVAVALSLDRDLDLILGRPVSTRMHAGETFTTILGLAHREPLTLVPPALGRDLLTDDDRWWRSWIERFAYEGPHAATIARSLLTLRLLTYAPSGAPVAAPTTSLPAPPGSERTWDYRFSWPRDASIGIAAFLAFGSHEEPRAFLEWFVNASRITRPRLDVLYDLDGRPVRHEHELDDVTGFDGGVPVRIGNAAASQHQLDVYGWVLDAAWAMHRAGERLSRSQWRAMRDFADQIVADWAQPDNGIWEERAAREHYVHSKLMAWAGLDRACRLAESYPARGRERRWAEQRERLREEIRWRGFSARADAYARIFDRDELDASVLMLPVIGFEDDPRRIGSTIDAVWSRLGAGGALLYRKRLHVEPTEGAFLPCSFWLVQALARTGRVSEAEAAFDELCALTTPLGLFAEQVDPRTRRPMGNFPQAFTHATFLQAAAALNEARGTSRGSARRSRAPQEPRPASAPRS